MAKNAACSITSLSLSALMMAFFAYTMAKLVQLTPVYRPLECTTVSHEFGDQVINGNFVNTSGTAVKSCRNPNPFNMRLYQGEPSQVWVKDEFFGLKPVGESIVTDSTFEAEGGGIGGLTLNIGLDLFEAMTLLAQPKVQVVTQLNAFAEAEMVFLGVGIKIAQASSKFCGFEMAMVPEQKVGYSACADTMDELVIPDINATLEEIDYITMSPEMYEYETGKKNMAFGTLLAVSGALAMLLLACGIRCGSGRSAGLRRRGEEDAKEAREVKVNTSGEEASAEKEDQSEANRAAAQGTTSL